VGETEGAAESAASPADRSNSARSGRSDEPAAGEEPESSSCGSEPHSFTGSTRVLLADGSTKAIDRVKAGDRVKDAVPGAKTTETHTVDKVIVTTTDRDFVDLTIATPKPPKATGKLAKAGLALAAGVAALATAGGHGHFDDDLPPPVLRQDQGRLRRGRKPHPRRRPTNPHRYGKGPRHPPLPRHHSHL
jgi:hypothetical protein